MTDILSHELHHLFYPRSIAVVGASAKGSGFMWGGNTFIEGAIKMNFQGRIYPVHPSANTILGLPCYRSVRDIPEAVDLVILSIPHSAVPAVMEDCVAGKVRFVHSFNAGFSETGRKENIEMEKELIRIGRQGGIRVIGPNCMGIYCPEGGVAWTNQFPTLSGRVGFVSQSGQLAGLFVRESSPHGINFSKIVSFGNAGDLQCHDFLDYFAKDEKTKTLGAYLEGIKDGRAFLEKARELTRKKPFVVWKAGQTEGGGRAVQSHTAAIAGSAEIWNALFKQAGIISVNTLEELVFTVATLQYGMALPKSNNMAILGGAGGGSVTMTDAAEREGLRVPHLSEKTIRSLEAFIPLEGNSVKNPLDMMAPLFKPENVIRLMALLRDEPNIDGLIFSQRLDWFIEAGGRSLLDMAVEMTSESLKGLGKPVYVVLEKSFSLEGDAARREVFDRLQRKGIAAFPSFEMAARVINNLYLYNKFLTNNP
jgi:acyl-CoA synthetase (NDP forming)